MLTESTRSRLVAYGFAVAATGLMIAFWLALPGDWGEHIPFSLFLLVVGGAALLGGFGPGMLAVVLGGMASGYLGTPRFTFTLGHKSDWVLLAIFVVTGPLAALACARLRRTMAESRSAHLEVQRLARGEAARLEALVAERTLRLLDAEKERKAILEAERAARAEAERANQLKDDFVATVSHELRTPLNAVLGWAELLRRPAAAPESVARGLGAIARNARTLDVIVGDLLDTSRIASGTLRVELARQSLPPIVEGALEDLRGTADAKGIEIHTALAPADVWADAGRLQQVIWNLVSNAIKFTPTRGRVDVSVARDDEGRVALRVRDTGQGIEPEFLPYVFERFRQADASSTRHHGGLGLGLAIVRHLVDLHHGTVVVTSEGRGLGTELTVTLPLATAAQGSPEPPGPAATPAARPLDAVNVLVVDDDPDARDIVRSILEGQGASVLVAASAREALEAFSARRPCVVVSDIGMPEMDGYELVRLLRSGGETGPRGLTAIALTAYARPEDRERALAAGFQAHLTKPIESATLVAAIAVACGRPALETRPS